MNFEFNLRTKTIIGKGSLARIKDYLEDNKFQQVGLIVDQALKENEFINGLIETLKRENIVSVVWYYDLPFEPDYASLDNKKYLFKNNQQSIVQILIAIGGGSVMDFGKGIATLITNHGPALSYRGFPKDLNPSIPLIAVPTTAGTASEVTFNAVFINRDDNKKLGINTHNNFPILAILDSDLTRGAPYQVALSAGVDAIVHTIESFAAKSHNLLTRMYAVQAFSLLFNNLETALLDKDNEQARENMLLGAYLAGVSLMNSGSGPSGGISYALGVICNIPHGLAGAITLPFLVKHNVDRGYTDYSVLYDQIEGVDKTLSIKEKSQLLVDAFFKLWEKLDVWRSVIKYQVNVEEDKALQEYLRLLQGAFDQNPLPFQYEDAVGIINSIFYKYAVK